TPQGWGEDREELAIGPGGRWAVGIGNDAKLAQAFGIGVTVTVRDARGGLAEAVCTGQPGQPTAVAIGPAPPGAGGECLALGGGWRARGGTAGGVRVWDVRAGDAAAADASQGPRAPRLVLRGHTAPVRALAFSADGRRLASASCDDRGQRGEVKIWDAAAGQE